MRTNRNSGGADWLMLWKRSSPYTSSNGLSNAATTIMVGTRDPAAWVIGEPPNVWPSTFGPVTFR